MNHCKTCKHFKLKTENSDIAYHGEGIGDCNSNKFVYVNDGVKQEKDGLGYWDYESYKAGFEVGEDFGCIHWAKNGQ